MILKKKNWLKILLGIIFIAFTVSPFSHLSAAGNAPIKIGVPIPLTGSMAYDGQQMRNAAIMAADEINAEGGLLGRQLELIFFDSKELLAETFALAAEELIGKEKVDALVCGYGGEAGVDTFGKYDVPFFHGEASEYNVSELVAKNPKYKENVFTVGDTSLTHGPLIFDAILKMAKNVGYEFPNKKIAVIRGTWTAIQQLTEGMTKRAEELGWEISFVMDAPEGTREWGGTMMKIRMANPGLIIFNVWDVTGMAQFRDQFNEMPSKSILFMGEGHAAPEYVILRGQQANGEIGYSSKGDLPNAKGRAWRKAYAKKFNIPQKETNAASGFQDAATYAGLKIWANAVKKVGDPSNYKAVSQAIKDSKYESIIGVHNFDENNRATTDGVPCKVFQVQDGKLVTVGLNDTLVSSEQFQLPEWVK